MLEMRPHCERCQQALPPDTDDAWICSYECTFCTTCTQQVLHCVCPNCQGRLVPRPSRRATGTSNTTNT